MVFAVRERDNGRVSKLRTFFLCALPGMLPVLPVLLKGSPILNNDMLVAYFCYFWDFHRAWAWDHPFPFWSSSYQCGMPMHAYWQSGWLYPITWLLFGPLSPHIGIHLYYAFHFGLGIFGFLKLGPRLGLKPMAAYWAGICFGLSGTMLARYEHATFLSGWTWMPLVLCAFLALRDAPGPKRLGLYASAVTLQALGGHPQASITTAILIGIFTAAAVTRRFHLRKAPTTGARPALGWLAAGHLLALLWCLPLAIPFTELVGRTDRFDGTAWEGGKAGGGPGAESASAEKAAAAAKADAKDKLEHGVFEFKKFSTGGMRPLHLASLAAPHALGSPSNASWWGGEVWGEVFVYIGGLGLFFCFFASPSRANQDMRLLWIVGLLGLWLAFGAHLGASQLQYHVPVLNNLRRPARFLILFMLALAPLSAHGFQRWIGRPKGRRAAGAFALAVFGMAGLIAVVRFAPGVIDTMLRAVEQVKKLDPAKDYGGKMAALLGRYALDALFLALSASAVWWFARTRYDRHWRTGQGYRYAPALLFIVLLADLVRVHWDHFYLFPRDFYRVPPASAYALDASSGPFWRVNHYLEYTGNQMWEMHNDPLGHFPLLDREKTALSCGIHAVFGYRHVSAHLPLMWPWDASLSPGGKSGRYLLSNRVLDQYQGDSLNPAGRFGEISLYEIEGWKPRLETLRSEGPRTGRGPKPDCPEGYSPWRDLCAREPRDGSLIVLGNWTPGDSLIFRERFDAGWRVRLGEGAWKKPSETPDRFQAIVFGENAVKVEWHYHPDTFFRMVALSLGLTTLAAVTYAFLMRLLGRGIGGRGH